MPTRIPLARAADLEVRGSTPVRVDEEIYVGNKVPHFESLKARSGLEYADMLVRPCMCMCMFHVHVDVHVHVHVHVHVRGYADMLVRPCMRTLR